MPKGQSSHIWGCLYAYVFDGACACLALCIEKWEESQLLYGHQRRRLVCSNLAASSLRNKVPPRIHSLHLLQWYGEYFTLPGNLETTKWGWGEWIPLPAGYPISLGLVTIQMPLLFKYLLPSLCWSVLPLCRTQDWLGRVDSLSSRSQRQSPGCEAARWSLRYHL